MKAACRWILIAAAMAIPLPAAAEQAFTIGDVEVFAGPSSEYPPIASLPPNASVNIAGCLADWSWCDVIFYGDRGWVYAGHLVVPYQGNRVAIVDYGPRVGITVVTFSLHSYWGRHYHSRPWYAEREQWASRVHVERDRGGPPPRGRARAESAQPRQGAPQGPPSAERPRQEASPDVGRAPPAAGGKPPEARQPRGAAPPARPQAKPPAERPRQDASPDAGHPPPGAGGKPPEVRAPRGTPPQAGPQGKPSAERSKEKGKPPGRGKGADEDK